jgi:phage gpG-like protein
MVTKIDPVMITRNLRKNLLVNDQLTAFDFKPSIGIAAGKIDKMGIDIRSFREPLKRVVQQVMAPSFLKNFDESGRPDKWEPLSDATMLIRGREGYQGDKPLVRTGLLRRTMGQLNIWTITTVNATIQKLPDKISYGAIHQGGFEGVGVGRKMSGYVKKAKGDLREAQSLLDDDLIMAMRTGTKLGGGARTANAIPQRQFALIQDEDREEIERIFVDWMRERAVGAGFL